MSKQIEKLEAKAIELKKELNETLDMIYELDETAGDRISSLINDESQMRS